MAEIIKIPGLGAIDDIVSGVISELFNELNQYVESLDLLRRYTTRQMEVVRSECEFLKIFGMAQPAPLVDFYYPAQVSTTIGRRLFKAEWLDQQRSLQKKMKSRRSDEKPIGIVDAMDFIGQGGKHIVLGGPGAGKTTFLRFLGLTLTDKGLFHASGLKTRFLPIFCQLPKFAKSSLSLFDYISADLIAKFGENGNVFLARCIAKSKAIVMLDSLDEVPVSERRNVLNAIDDFVKMYPKANVIVSCRTADYDAPIDSFREVELARLSATAIEKIVAGWFKEAPSRAESLLRLIISDPELSSLVETPLLLSLVCIQYRHDLALPKRKAELFRRCVDALLKDWDAQRGFRRESAYENLSDDRKERLFEFLAGTFMCESRAVVFPESDLLAKTADCIERLGLDRTDAHGVIREIEKHHGILEQFSSEFFCFSHTSLQEYFAAKWLVSKRAEISALQKNMGDDHWSGIIEFCVALREDPKELLDVMVAKADLGELKTFPALARRCRLLHLLYRCLSMSPILRPIELRRYCDVIVRGQARMTDLFVKYQVIPFAFLNKDGINQPYYLMGRKRETLHQALLPLRRLSNDVFSSPLNIYSDSVVAYCTSEIGNDRSIPAFSLLLRLCVPLALSGDSRIIRLIQRLSTLKDNPLSHFALLSLQSVSNNGLRKASD